MSLEFVCTFGDKILPIKNYTSNFFELTIWHTERNSQVQKGNIRNSIKVVDGKSKIVFGYLDNFLATRT